MPTQIAAIARNAFVESLRQPLLFLVVLFSGIIQIFNTFGTNFAMGIAETSEVTGDNKLLFDVGLATIFLCAMLLAAFLATAVLSREIENKTVLTVVSKPIPRPALVVGKYLGVSGAIVAATITMMVFLLLALRHGVMTNASDELDGPVLLFGLSGVALALGLGGWMNYYYGWSFPQVVIVALLPLMVAAYIGILFVGKGWKIQSPAKDFLPQVTLVCACLAMSVLVLAAAATAASTRLGQVMTVVVCSAFFLVSLLSNYFFGRHAFVNTPVARVEYAEPQDPTKPGLAAPGDSYLITLRAQYSTPVKRGDPLYYGRSPSGFPVVPPRFTPYTGRLDETSAMLSPSTPPALVVVSTDNDLVTVRHVGNSSLGLARAPESGDYLFIEPTRVNPAALAIWGVLPNLQFFWLLDAITQNQHIPGSHARLVFVYGGAQIIALLALAVMLFQRRDVG